MFLYNRIYISLISCQLGCNKIKSAFITFKSSINLYVSLYCLIVYLCSSILFLWNTCLFTRHYNTIYNLLHWKNLLLRIIHYIPKTNYNSGPRNLQIDQINRPQASYVPPGADKRSFKFHFIASPPLIWQSTAVTGGRHGYRKVCPACVPPSPSSAIPPYPIFNPPSVLSVYPSDLSFLRRPGRFGGLRWDDDNPGIFYCVWVCFVFVLTVLWLA